MRRGLPALLVLTGCAALASAGTLSRENDPYTGRSSILIDDMHVVGPGRMAHLDAIGVPGSDPGSPVLVSIRTQWTGWHYLECHSFDWLADGQPVPHDEPTHHGSVLYGGEVSETVGVHMRVDGLARIGGARVASARICDDEYTFTAAQLAQFAAFVRAVR
jgi:hypothetical protein